MKRFNLIVILLAIGVFLIAGIVVLRMAPSIKEKNAEEMTKSSMEEMSSSPQKNGNNEMLDLTDQTDVTMDIQDFAFSKPNIKIKKGTKVTWTNRDTAKHNAFSDASDGPKGELLAKGESYSFTFDTVGIKNYYCTPHPYMKGIVNVVD